MSNNVWHLIIPVSIMIGIMAAILFFSHHYTLDGIKSKTVGDGQHGTARWATKKEIQRTFKHVPFQTKLWRSGKRSRVSSSAAREKRIKSSPWWTVTTSTA